MGVAESDWKPYIVCLLGEESVGFKVDSLDHLGLPDGEMGL